MQANVLDNHAGQPNQWTSESKCLLEKPLQMMDVGLEANKSWGCSGKRLQISCAPPILGGLWLYEPSTRRFNSPAEWVLANQTEVPPSHALLYCHGCLQILQAACLKQSTQETGNYPSHCAARCICQPATAASASWKFLAPPPNPSSDNSPQPEACPATETAVKLCTNKSFSKAYKRCRKECTTGSQS